MILCNQGDLEFQGARLEVLAELGMIITAMVGEGFADMQEILKICALASTATKDGAYNYAVKNAERYEKKVERMEVDE